jgi:hypothetical protein
MTKDISLLRVYDDVSRCGTHHRVHLDFRERTEDRGLDLEQPKGSYNCFIVAYNKTFYRDLTCAVYD